MLRVITVSFCLILARKGSPHFENSVIIFIFNGFIFHNPYSSFINMSFTDLLCTIISRSWLFHTDLSTAQPFTVACILWY